MTAPYPFILADNQDITRAGMRYLIASRIRDARIACAGCKRDLIRELDGRRDAVVVIDYTLFDLSSIDELRILAIRFPEVRWVLFSEELSEGFIRQAMAEENVSIVLKENSEEEIVSALECACQGKRYLCRQIAGVTLASHERGDARSGLTQAETEILRLIARGMSVKEIAERRVSSAHTIITHKKNIFRKLGVNNVYEATKYALRAGLVELAEYYI